MNAINFLKSTAGSFFNAASSCARLIPTLPSIQISTTAKVALFAIVSFSLLESALSVKNIPIFLGEIPFECVPGASVTLFDQGTRTLLELDFFHTLCVNVGPNLSKCGFKLDFSGYGEFAQGLMLDAAIAFDSFSKCLKQYNLISKHITEINLDENSAIFAQLVNQAY